MVVEQVREQLGREAADGADRQRRETSMVGGGHGREHRAGQRPGVELLGPTEAPIQRLKGRTRWLVLLKATSREALRAILGAMVDEQTLSQRGKLRVSVDVDPLMML